MDLHAWITDRVDCVERSVDDDVLPSVEAAVVLRRCEADRRILARHSVDPGATDSWLFATACHGCGTYGDCDDPETDNLNDCPELRDLAYAHGIGKDELDGLDRPKPPEQKRASRAAPAFGLRDIMAAPAVPSALRGPAWSQRHG